MVRFLIAGVAILAFVSVAFAEKRKNIFDVPENTPGMSDPRKKPDTAKTVAKQATPAESKQDAAKPAVIPTPLEDDTLSKIPEIKRIENIHERLISDADSTRIAEYRKYLEKIKKGGGIDRVVAVQARLRQLEDESENPKKTADTPRLRILSATYGTILYGVNDVTEILKKKVNGKTGVKLVISDTDFAGNFEPGNKRENYMIVRYSVSGGPAKILVRQTGQQLVLP